MACWRRTTARGTRACWSGKRAPKPPLPWAPRPRALAHPTHPTHQRTALSILLTPTNTACLPAPTLLRSAQQVADRVLPAYDTPTRVPLNLINLRTQVAHNPKWNQKVRALCTLRGARPGAACGSFSRPLLLRRPPPPQNQTLAPHTRPPPWPSLARTSWSSGC